MRAGLAPAAWPGARSRGAGAVARRSDGESLRCTRTTRPRSRSPHTWCGMFRPARRRAGGAGVGVAARLPTRPSERPLQAHHHAQCGIHRARRRAALGLEVEGMPTGCLTAEAGCRGRASADEGRRRAPASGSAGSWRELETPQHRPAGRVQPRADRAVDLTSRLHQHVVVDHDVDGDPRANTAGARRWGGCAGDADPPAVHPVVFVHGLAAAAPAAEAAHRRLHTINRGAEQRRVPGTATYRSATRSRSADGHQRDVEPVQVPICQTIRSGPAEPRGAGERVDFVPVEIRRRLQGVGPRRVPPARAVGLEPAARPRHPRQGARGNSTANAGDMLPLVGTKCGSPAGSRSRSPTPAAPSSCSIPTTRAPTTRRDLATGSGKTMTANCGLAEHGGSAHS